MKSHNFIDLTGLKFGLLIVKTQAPRIKQKIARWSCDCDCGNKTVVDGRHLRESKIKSCGCLQKLTCKNIAFSHGMTDTPEYKIWCGMKRRCYNKNEKSYPRYGGRGITVDNRWIDSFETFFKEMGRRPSEKHSIERIDNNANYCIENCKWSTVSEQSSNRRSNVMIECFGKRHTLHDWSLIVNIKPATIKHRIKHGWPVEKALSHPLHNTQNKLTKKVPCSTVISVETRGHA